MHDHRMHISKLLDRESKFVKFKPSSSGRTDQVAKLLDDDNKDEQDARAKRTSLIWAVIGDHPDTVSEKSRIYLGC